MSALIDLVKLSKGKPTDKVSLDLYNKRKAICHSCPFRKRITGSCGTLFVGGTVNWNGEEKELCGCITDDKNEYVHDGCPLGKW